ncbi:hypothetical protein BT63DRAFT_373316, partial [Microthyrium microscopicum]
PGSGPVDTPRVDYLLFNGGLPFTVPRSFLSAPTANAASPTQPFHSPMYGRTFGAPTSDASKIFHPFYKLLDDYMQVMSKSGSIAVATGYRSVARRLLDRLEAVFNRNISSETCECIMCMNSAKEAVDTASEDEESGLSWGEVLEYVSGRRELPSWPPFSLSSEAIPLASVVEAPMQKLDVDVPDEWRDHFVRQSKKTKSVVQAWLASQPEMASSPPQEVDDDTLVFAMITHLEPEKRRLFTALVRGMSSLPSSRAPTPGDRPRSEFMSKTALALQRLYRLPNVPRDAECGLFLLQNPVLHNVLATLAAISAQEWDILVSGRFDGFLWSGADNSQPQPSPTGVPLPASRTTTPFTPPSTTGTPFFPGSIRRTQTPGLPSTGAPVQMDEDTEIATLAEIEREIYSGMEALEDAFETLHVKAEQVRNELQRRCAGLTRAASARRGDISDGQSEHIGIRGNTPANSGGMWAGNWDDDEVDTRSELGPDDSASNISHHHRRRRTRDLRRELKTPVTVAEEDEDD